MVYELAVQKEPKDNQVTNEQHLFKKKITRNTQRQKTIQVTFPEEMLYAWGLYVCYFTFRLKVITFCVLNY